MNSPLPAKENKFRRRVRHLIRVQLRLKRKTVVRRAPGLNADVRTFLEPPEGPEFPSVLGLFLLAEITPLRIVGLLTVVGA